jgi:hypothetical protein
VLARSKFPIRYRGRDGRQCWRNIVRTIDCRKLVENDGSTFCEPERHDSNPLRGRDVRALRGAKKRSERNRCRFLQ